MNPYHLQESYLRSPYAFRVGLLTDMDQQLLTRFTRTFKREPLFELLQRENLAMLDYYTEVIQNNQELTNLDKAVLKALDEEIREKLI